MSQTPITPAALKARFLQLDLQSMIATALVAAILLFAAALGTTSYLVLHQHIVESAQELLDARAQMQRREIEYRLGTLLGEAAAIADSGARAAAHADAAERQRHFAPLLKDFKLSWPGATLALIDQRRLESIGAASGAGARQSFSGMIEGRPAFGSVAHSEPGRAFIEVAFALARTRGDGAAGAVLLHLPLDTLALAGGGGNWGVYDRAGQRLAGRPAQEASLESRSALQLPPPLDALGLTHVFSVDRASALDSLDALEFAYIAVCALLLLVAARGSMSVARIIATPLHDLAAALEQIARTGRPLGRIAADSASEFDRIAAAFNNMVDRLAGSYAALETRVETRTRELATAKRTAEKARELLDEVVHCVAVGFAIYDEEDRLVRCNEAYTHYYKHSRRAIVPGATFAEILRHGVESGQYADPMQKEEQEAFLRERIAQHRLADGHPWELKLCDGRWLQVVEHRTPSGHTVSSRIDITGMKLASEALNQRELYLRATLDNLPFQFWLKEADGRYLAVNRAFAQACGMSDPNEIKGLHDADLWSDEEARAYRAEDLDIMRSGREKSLEVVTERNGERCWLETYRRPIVADDGTLHGIVGFARDVSERRRVERALRESETRWQLAMAGTNDGIWDWDMASGKVFYSARWKDMLGYAPGDIADRIEEWESLLHPQDRDRVLAANRLHLRGETDFYQAEFRMRSKSDGYKWILARGRALFDDTGRAVRVVGSITDMTERRRTEDAVLDHAGQLDAIFQLSPDGFLAFDAARQVRYACPAFHRITGLAPEETIGLDEAEFSRLLASRCVPAAAFRGVAAMRPARPASAIAHELVELAMPRGRTLEIGLHLSDAPNVSQVLHVRDVTREIELDRMKSEFLSMAAHELRTPMASIYGFTELLLTQRFEAEAQHDLVATIHRNADLMSSIINELLDLARIEARRGMDFVFETLPAQDLIARIVDNFKAPQGRDRPGLMLPQAPLWIRADAKKMEQAVANLLTNAYKYSPDGGAVRVSMLAENEPGTGARVGVRITDEGIGMTPAQLARVWERFYRADTSGAIPGTGLGTSIVKEIVELHGGGAEMASEPGKGTTVTLWIPAAAAPGNGAAQPEQPALSA